MTLSEKAVKKDFSNVKQFLDNECCNNLNVGK